MSSTFLVRSFIYTHVGSSAKTFDSLGYTPSRVEVNEVGTGIKYEFSMGSGKTLKTSAAGAVTSLTTTGITWDETTKALTFGTDAGLCGAANVLAIKIYK